MSDVWLPTMELDDGGDYQSLVDENDALRTDNDRLREEVAGLTAALTFYAEDDNGCSFADYDTDTKAFGKRARAALAANPATRAGVGAGLTAALTPFLRYANELLWGDRGVRGDEVVLRWPYYGPPRVIVRRSDFRSLRAASPVPNPGLPISPVVPNPGLPISPVVPNPGLSVSPAPPTEGGESS